MSKNLNTLDQLKKNRSSNVQKTAAWSSTDFDEMLQIYVTAKEIATDSGDIDSIAILEEKISQLQEAAALKSFPGQLDGETNA